MGAFLTVIIWIVAGAIVFAAGAGVQHSKGWPFKKKRQAGLQLIIL